MSRRRSTRNRFLGAFSLQDNEPIVGELHLRGRAAGLELHAGKPIGTTDRHTTIHGRAYTGEHLTLIDCLRTSEGNLSLPGDSKRYTATLSPAFVAVGPQHFDPDLPCVRCIHFCTTDLHTLFYDFHAFGIVFDSRGTLSKLLEELREDRAKAVGEQPILGYFTGRFIIAEVLTNLGAISVSHGVRHNFGGPSGVVIKNRITVSIEPKSPSTFAAAVTAMTDVSLFLSIAAGRGQGISRIRVELADNGENLSRSLQVHMNLPWKTRSASDRFRPHPADLPLRPIENPDEFRRVMANWIENLAGSRFARYRYLSCLRKGNRYTPDRLITAANMFELLPGQAIPADRQLSPDLAKVRDECIAKFRALPDSPERSSALSALGRLGSPFLMKKVLHRLDMIQLKLGGRFPDLDWVATIAVRCRNVYVHGSSKDFDFEKAEPFVPFLTDALEFIFGASDLIEAGWSTSGWLENGSAGGHSFARFREDYVPALEELKTAMQGGS